MQKISPFLWYENDNAIEVAKYYKTVFGSENVQIKNEESHTYTPSGHVQVVSIRLFGTTIVLMSTGKHDSFNDAVSLVVDCEDQAEIDRLWNTLVADGGKESMCGWCHDKYGVRWQIVPKNMPTLIATTSAAKAMMGMKKIVIAELEAAI